MFICQKCDKVSQPNEPSVLVVSETRQVQYTNKLSNGDVRVSRGWEIVSELRVCSDCYKASEPF